MPSCAGSWPAIAIILLVQADAHLLQPFIMSRSVHVHPLAIVLAVVAGTTLGGIAGALIAVPLTAFLNTAVQAIRAEPVPADTPLAAERPPPADARGGEPPL